MEKEKFMEKREMVLSFIKSGNSDKSDLIAVLHRTQEASGYIPASMQVEIAKYLQVHLSDVAGVISFYTYFTTKPRGRYGISVCLGTACYVKGAGAIMDRISRELDIRIGETTSDGIFTLEGCRCVGACGLAPVLMINEKVYGRLTEKEIPSLLQKYREMQGQESGEL